MPIPAEIKRTSLDASRHAVRYGLLAGFAVLALVIATGFGARALASHHVGLPQSIRDTGLYRPGSLSEIDDAHLEFAPQYPLWSDGARKRRWIFLPQGTSIDASNPDAWEFPIGTRLWKEFALDRRIETRFIERIEDGSWRFGTYVWNEDGSDALLAPTSGIASLPTHRGYAIPGEFDCRACHEGAAAPVLGFSALQLSPDRDPLAPHAESSNFDLTQLIARGLIKNLPPSVIASPPKIAARSPLERAALGYLHGNCAHCHNDNGAPVPVDLTLSQSVSHDSSRTVLSSMLGAGARYRAHEMHGHTAVVVAGRPEASLLLARMRSRYPQTQMPPLGTQLIDTEALALIERWIAEQSPSEELTQ